MENAETATPQLRPKHEKDSCTGIRRAMHWRGTDSASKYPRASLPGGPAEGKDDGK